MKYSKIFCALAIAIILALLVVAIPATPALAARYIDLDPERGKIGDKITITGEGFNKSTEDPEVDKYASIYFSSDEADTSDDIDDEVTSYKLLREPWLDYDGEFETTFKVPSELDDGDDEEDVASGTYYVYVCHYGSKRIRAVAEFTVIGGEITIDPTDGAVGTEVEISGEDFDKREYIIIEYDGVEVEIQSGDTETDRYGEFWETMIIIPESTAGDHTITVIGEESGNEVEGIFTVEPEITISPTSAAVDTTVTVSGTGFGKRSDVTIFLDSAKVATETTDRYGNFDATFDVPVVVPGSFDLEAWDEDDNSDTVEFSIIATTAGLNPTTGHVGTEVTVSGSGFIAGGTVTVKYDGSQVTTAPIGSDGTFSATFSAPVSVGGEHTVAVSDGTNSEQFTFTMESDPPSIPRPLLPLTQSKAEAEAYFDWGDVDDPSLPVTYTLQIASDADFTTIVLEKEGLTSSEYTITPGEKLESVSKKDAYYWRVKATDGASNESNWSGAGSFYVGFAFVMPTWAIYILFGFGALVLGAAGYWLGRRTAYY